MATHPLQAAAAESQAIAYEAEEELRALRDGTADKQDSLRCVGKGGMVDRMLRLHDAGMHMLQLALQARTC